MRGEMARKVEDTFLLVLVFSSHFVAYFGEGIVPRFGEHGM